MIAVNILNIELIIREKTSDNLKRFCAKICNDSAFKYRKYDAEFLLLIQTNMSDAKTYALAYSIEPEESPINIPFNVKIIYQIKY